MRSEMRKRSSEVLSRDRVGRVWRAVQSGTGVERRAGAAGSGEEKQCCKCCQLLRSVESARRGLR